MIDDYRQRSYRLRSMLRILLSSISLLLCWNVFADKYQMADLEVLEKQGAYQEFLRHAKDVRPQFRDKVWNRMVNTMSDLMINDYLRREKFNAQDFNEVQKVSSWVEIKSNEFFHFKRVEWGKVYFKKCTNTLTLDRCSFELTQFWRLTPYRDELALSIAKIAVEENLPVDPWFFLSKVPMSSKANVYCREPIVRESLYRQLKDFYSERDQLKMALNTTLNSECLRGWRPALNKLLRHQDNKLSSFAFQILEINQMLTEREKDLFYVQFVLQNPYQGHLFNYAWRTLKTLADHPARRNWVLKELSDYDPLPGKLFNSPQKERKQAILNHLVKTFPEYLSFYGKTCLNYLEGRGEFPTGNPTPECDQFFSEKKIAKKVVSQEISLRYSSIKSKWK